MSQTQLQASRKARIMRTLQRDRQLWLLCIPILVWVAIFCYYPMYGLLMAFVDYQPGMSIWDCQFVGLQYFRDFVTKPIFKTLLRNTLAMSGLSLTISFVIPIVFAFMLNELYNLKVKKVVQTASYLPHFISWVVVGSMVTNLLSSDGTVNSLLIHFGFTEKPISFLNKGTWYWTIYTIINTWKSMGWSSIIYLSAMAGVDNELYEAGAIDGLGRLGMALHITLPTIVPTIVLLWIMGVGNILSAGFDQHLIIGNPLTQQYWDVIDTYAYRYGVQQGFYSVGTAVSLMKSVVGFVLVLIVNAVSRKVSDVALF